MSRHLVTVCMFCLLCAAHSVCGTHIDDNDLDQNDRVVTFNHDFQKGPFDLMSQSYDPILDDTPQDHDVKKKNLSAERRLRYMQKLNKIRSHRRYDFDSGRDRASSEEEMLVLDNRNVDAHPRLEAHGGDHKNRNSKISDKLSVVDDGFLNSVLSDKNLDLNEDDLILKGRISDISGDTEQIFNSEENKQRIFDQDANQRTFDLMDRRFGDSSMNLDEKNSVLSDKGRNYQTSSNTDLSERLFGFKDDVVLGGNKFLPNPVKVSDKDVVKDNSVVLRTKRSVFEEVIRVDPSAYVEQIFNQFGDAKSMTMNLTGFNELLRFLDLQTLIEGGKQNIKKPDYVYKEAPLQDAEVTCLSSAQLVTAVASKAGHSHGHSHEHSHGHSDGHSESHNHGETRSHSDDTLINEKTMQSICPILLYQKLANKSLERNGCVIANQFRGKSGFRAEDDVNAYAQNQMHVWVYSFLSILVISACGLLGVAVIPIMHKSYYNHLLQFLVALAVGTLCGDALLHLMPHAMSPLDGEEEPSHDDSMWKGLVAMMGVVFFYFTEKGLTVAAEMRKRRQKKDDTKLPPRVRVLKDDNHTKSRVSGSSSNPFLKIFNSKNKGKDVQKTCKHKYSEYPYCYDEIDTETQNDHHLRENQSPKPNLSIVSSKVATEAKEDGNAKDWLLNYMEESDGKPKVGENNVPVEMNNINAKKKDSELKEGESYTVILREHSRAHHGHSHSHGHVHAPPSSMSSVAWMVIMGDGLHNFTDGMAIGAAFASNLAGGFSTAIAVLCHELPHELGDFAVLLKAGMSVRRAVWYNALSSILCLGGMVCGVLVGHAPSATRWLFALAAGMFLYIALVDMMPELSSSHSKEGTFCQCVLQLLGLATGVGIMLLIALYEHDLRTLFG